MSLRIGGPKPGVENVRYSIKVEPSVRVLPGVFVETNEHFKLDGADAARRLMEDLERSWQASQEYGKKVAEHLFAEFYGRE